MKIKYMILINFRNYDKLELELSDKTNIFIGDNAQGKTNILEAIYYSSIGKSHRTNKDREVIKWGNNEAYAMVYVKRSRIDKKIEMKFFKHGSKGLNINSIKITKLSELIGALNVVMFSPEDLKIVKESPSYRRKFIDMEICKLSKKYLYNLNQYSKVLSEKNAAMKKLNGISDILDIYDTQLAKYGAEIIKSRLNYIEKLNHHGKNIHNDITASKETINFKYVSNINLFSDNLEQVLLNGLTKNRKRDIDNRMTSVGPHRDDFSIEINEIDTRIYGSQGQQRTSVLTIKFASLSIIKEITGEYPVLLLDDVLSELDSSRQQYILNSIKDVQTLITCTGINDIKEQISSDARLFRVKDGEIIKTQ